MAVKLSKSLFIHTPKAGGSWIRYVFELAQVPIQLLRPHIGLGEALAECPEAYGWPSFSFIRHPYTWYRSYWCFKMNLGWDAGNELDDSCKADTFPAFMGNVLERKPGFLSNLYDYYTRGVTHVGRFETLRESFSRILDQIQEPITAAQVYGIPDLNVVSRTEEWKARGIFLPEIAAPLAQAEARAFATYGYEKTPVPAGGHLIWLTGLPSAGKTTIARAVAHRLGAHGCHVEVLDGDVMRVALSPDLGFSKEHRDEQVRRVGEFALPFVRNGTIVIVAMVSPYREARKKIRALFGSLTEVHVDCSVDVCMARDPKGLWKRAVAGQLSGMTGLTSPYEAPENPDILVESAVESVESSSARIVRKVLGLLS